MPKTWSVNLLFGFVCLCLTCTGLVLDEWTLMPWQRLLEGLGEIEEAPADDDIVVESHKEAHLRTREAST